VAETSPGPFWLGHCLGGVPTPHFSSRFFVMVAVTLDSPDVGAKRAPSQVDEGFTYQIKKCTLEPDMLSSRNGKKSTTENSYHTEMEPFRVFRVFRGSAFSFIHPVETWEGGKRTGQKFLPFFDVFRGSPGLESNAIPRT
jgi:hypothetical protein